MSLNPLAPSTHRENLKTLDDVERSLAQGKRLDFDDGMALFSSHDLLRLGGLATTARRERHGERAYYNRNVRLEVTNVCVAACKFCSFAELKEGAPGSYTLTVKQALEILASRVDPERLPTEVHIVNGLHPGLPFSYYEDLLSALREKYPTIHRKCFTAVEIQYFADRYEMSVDEVLRRLRKAGLDSLPGGGAEIFDEDIRSKIARGKASAAQWLDVHRKAHAQGMFTNATMLYGHVEGFEHRVSHLLQLRALQDESLKAGRGNLQAFIPLAFHPYGNSLQALPGPTGVDDLKTLAASRLLLDNVPHLKAYWVSSTPKIAQAGLWFGADDVDGTIVSETIYRAAGKAAPEGLSESDLIRLIREAGRLPVERDTLYRVIKEHAATAPEGQFDVRTRRKMFLEVLS